MKITAFALLALIMGAPVYGQAPRFLPTGFIQNDSGVKCTYKQRTEPESKHFTDGTMVGIVGVITFDNPACMKDSELGSDVNKMMINNVIARWYSHSDADFQTRVSELYPTSLFQKRGVCMQSKKYPIIGVTLDYVVAAGSITQVFHGSSAQGCKR